MTQSTKTLIDGTGAEVAARISEALYAIDSMNAGPVAPAEVVLYSMWLDTSTTPPTMKMCSSVGPVVWTTIGYLSANQGMIPMTGNSTLTGNLGVTGTFQVSGKTTFDNVLDEKGVTLASATTTNLGSVAGNFIDVTGTTTITGLGTAPVGASRTLRFTGALTLTHNATSLIIPGGQNIKTMAGDIATFRSINASGYWVMTNYQRFDGAMQETMGTAITAAATTDLGTSNGNYCVISSSTGPITVTSLGTMPAGIRKTITFSVTGGGSLTLTCSANLLLPGVAISGTMAITDGDSAVFHSLGNGAWRMTNYQKSSLVAKIWATSVKAVDYTISPTTDYGTYFIYSATVARTLTLPTAVAAGVGFVFGFRNNNTLGALLNVTAAGADKIEDVSTIPFGVGSGGTFISDGVSKWYRMETGVSPSGPPAFVVGSQVFTSGVNTFTVPAGTWFLRTTLWGGGGGGGSAGAVGTTGHMAGGGAGGGGGGFATGIFSVVPGQTYTVTAGAGGAGGTSVTGTKVGVAGTSGGTSSFATLLSATGGAGGAGGAAGTNGFPTANAVSAGGIASGTGTLMNGGTGGNSTGSSASYGNGGGGGGSSGGLTAGSKNGGIAVGNEAGVGATGSDGAALGVSITGITRESGGSHRGGQGKDTGIANIGGDGGSPGGGGGGGGATANAVYSSGIGGGGGTGKVIIEW